MHVKHVMPGCIFWDRPHRHRGIDLETWRVLASNTMWRLLHMLFGRPRICGWDVRVLKYKFLDRQPFELRSNTHLRTVCRCCTRHESLYNPGRALLLAWVLHACKNWKGLKWLVNYFFLWFDCISFQLSLNPIFLSAAFLSIRLPLIVSLRTSCAAVVRCSADTRPS